VIRRRFCELGIMRMTADYVPHNRARCYEWLLDDLGKERTKVKQHSYLDKPGRSRL
jgi:hypothetical protein